MLTAACPGISILATSREPLGLSGEHVQRLAPMTFGEALFIERARSVRPEFEPDSHVRELCKRIDSLPLAIELAAARAGVMSTAEMVQSLDEQFRLLRGGGRALPARHQSMDALIEWSYGLLAQPERAIFRCLGLFAGSFSLETAAVAADIDGLDAADLVWSLVDKSLVVADLTENATRYRMMDTIRGYARHQLEISGEFAIVALRLARWYLERYGPQHFPDRIWIDGIAPEEANMRALVRAVAALDAEVAQLLAVGVMRFALGRAQHQESLAELEALIESATAATPARAEMLLMCARQMVDRGDLARARVLLAEASSLAQQVGPPLWNPLGVEKISMMIAQVEQDYPRVIDTSATLLERSDVSPRDRAIFATYIGDAHCAFGAYEESLRWYDRAIEIDVVQHDDEGLVSDHLNAAETAIRQGDLVTSAHHQRASLELASELGHVEAVALNLVGSARLAAARGDTTTAVQLHAKADAVLGDLGYLMRHEDQRLSAAMLASARAQLRDDVYQTECAVGVDLSLPEAIALALAALGRVASHA
jgi:predicted ATPase